MGVLAIVVVLIAWFAVSVVVALVFGRAVHVADRRAPSVLDDPRRSAPTPARGEASRRSARTLR